MVNSRQRLDAIKEVFDNPRKEIIMKMECGEDLFDMIMGALWENVIGPDVIDQGDYDEIYGNMDGHPDYEGFCELRDRFINRDMTDKEAMGFLASFDFV